MNRPHGRALLVSPRFFGYEAEIASALERRGLEVELVDERPSNAAVMKAVFRVRPAAARHSVKRYYWGLLKTLRGDYDLVLVIKGEVVPGWFLQAIRASSPRARFVYYTFDSLENNPHASSIIALFDDRYSFQREAPAAGLALKHLFYVPAFYPLGTAEARWHEVAFIGTLHSGRYRFVKRILDAFASSFTYFYAQAHWYFRIKRLTDPRFRAVDPADVRFEKLDRATVAEVFRNSLAVLDMQHDKQEGLTMRSFEVIASGAYLVTANAAAEAGPLGATGRVLTMPAEPSEADVRELADRLHRLPVPTSAPDGFEQYSVDAWVGDFVSHLGEVRS